MVNHAPISHNTLAEETAAAMLAHQHAIQRWLQARREDRAGLWPAVEAAWREVARLRAGTDAHHHAIETFARHGKIRSTA